MSKQLLFNNEFSDGLSWWINKSSHSATAEIELNNGNQKVRLQPTVDGTARITQQVAVEGNTQYQLSGNIFSEGDSYGYIGVQGFDGEWSVETSGDNVSGEYRIVFTTSAETEFINVFAEAYKQQIDPIAIDDLQLVSMKDDLLSDASKDSIANSHENHAGDQEPDHLLTKTTENKVSNADFSANLSGWINESSHTATAEIELVNGNHKVRLQPTVDGTARITQQVAVEGNTQYQLSGTIYSEGDSYGYIGVEGFDGKWSVETSGDNVSGEYTIIFTTSAETEFVSIFVEAYKQQTDPIAIDDLQLVSMKDDLLSEVPQDTIDSSQENHTGDQQPNHLLRDSTENKIFNADFSSNLSGWIDESSHTATAEIELVNGNQKVRLQPTVDGTARITQQVAVEGNTQYQLSGTLFSEGDSYGYIGVKGFDGQWSEETSGDNVSGEYNIIFTTSAETEFINVFAEAYKQQTDAIVIDNFLLTPITSSQPIELSDNEEVDNPANTIPIENEAINESIGIDEPPSGNLVKQGDFEGNFEEDWTLSGGVDVVSVDGNNALELTASADQPARITQYIEGLKPETLYTFSTRVRTNNSWASFGVDQGAQHAKTNSVTGNQWQEKRFVFYTESDSNKVRLFLEAYQGEEGEVNFDDVSVVEGVLPLPSASSGEGWESPPLLPKLVDDGDEMILNHDFAEGLDKWVTDHASWTESGELTLTATQDETGRAVQDIPFALAPNTRYTLHARVKATGEGATIGITDRDELTASLQINNSEYNDLALSFTTDDEYRKIRVVLEQYKGSEGELSIENISLLAEGGEWLDTPEPIPAMTTDILFDDFNSPLDPQKWLVVDKAWGGDNGGLVPENVELKDGLLLLHAHGDEYNGDVVGHNERKTRVGSGIATRDYYASGRYEVRARIPEDYGAASAFWTFHYMEHFPSETEYWEEPSRVRNSEIDWEFPTALQDGSSHDPISFDNARLNSWGGELGGEGAHHPGRLQVINDGEFHTYGIDWHSGDEATTPAVIWSIDDQEVYRHEGVSFGQDNIPSIASRFWLGIWFPAAGYKELIDGEYVDRVGWAGDPSFDETTLEIDWVRITPFNEGNDRWLSETWPNGWYALPHEYPDFTAQTFLQPLTESPKGDLLIGTDAVDIFEFKPGDSTSLHIDHIIDYTIGLDRILGWSTDSSVDYLGELQDIRRETLTAPINQNALAANDAASFTVNERTYLLMNDSQPGFDWDKDTLIEITGFSGDINQLSIG